jgi:hypothetical protein
MYALSLFEGKLFTSDNGGSTFTGHPFNLPNALPLRGRRGDNRGGQDHLYAAPGAEGDLWIPAFDGLYHSTNTDHQFTKINGVIEIHAFGFGRAKDANSYPALYLAGVVNGIDGIFRSDNEGQTWVRINDDKQRWSLILQITGDPKVYGRVYVGIHGRGIFYGDRINLN